MGGVAAKRHREKSRRALMQAPASRIRGNGVIAQTLKPVAAAPEAFRWRVTRLAGHLPRDADRLYARLP